MGTNNMSFDEKIKKLVENLPEHRPSTEKRREFIARLYNVRGGKKPFYGSIFGARTAAFAAVACIVTVILSVSIFLFSPMYPSIMNVEGTVKIYRASSNSWIFAKSHNIKLGKDDILKTFADGQADLVIRGVYHIRLKHDSEIRLAKSISRAASGDIGYALEKGRMLANYDKDRKTGKALDIETPQAMASALGTDFMVESSPLISQTMVGVLDGSVRVTSLELTASGKEVIGKEIVKAGQRTIVRKGEAPSVPTRLPENELLNMEELYSIGRRPQVALLISTGPTRTRELLSVTPLYIASDRSEILAKKFEPIAMEINRAIKERSKEVHIESIKRLEALIREYPNPKYDVQFLLFIGAYYKYLGEYNKSIDTFERIVKNYPASSMTSIAQCAIGLIYEENLKETDKAKIAFEKVVSNYPQSPEVEEASADLARLK